MMGANEQGSHSVVNQGRKTDILCVTEFVIVLVTKERQLLGETAQGASHCGPVGRKHSMHFHNSTLGKGEVSIARNEVAAI